MRFVCFKSHFRPNFVRLCRRHTRRESEGTVEWVLSMARVWKFSLGHPPPGGGANGWRVRGRRRDRNIEAENGQSLPHQSTTECQMERPGLTCPCRNRSQC
jgi:hypothetical protein